MSRVVPSRTLRVAVVAAVTVVGVVLAVRGTAPAPAAVSTSATAWTLPRLGGGGAVSLSSLRGRPLVVNFFASWCSACRDEFPAFASLSGEVRDRVTFVGVNSEETGNGLSMAQQYGVAWWTLVTDSGGAADSGLHDSLGARGMPLTAFYDSNGRLLSVVEGAMTGPDLISRMHTLFGVSV